MVIHISLRCVEPPRTLLDDCSVHKCFAEGIYPVSVIGVNYARRDGASAGRGTQLGVLHRMLANTPIVWLPI